MKLKKLHKQSKGRMTVKEEMASYFKTAWTVEEGYFYLTCIQSLSPENKQLIEMLEATRREEAPNECVS